jgi:hypothetical protein
MNIEIALRNVVFPAVFDERPEVRQLECRGGSKPEEVDWRDRVDRKFPDAEGGAFPGDFRPQRKVDPAAVLEGCIENRLIDRDVLPGDLGESEDVLVQVNLIVVLDICS